MSFKDKRKSLTISTVAVAETVPWDKVIIKLYLNLFTIWFQVTFIVSVGGKCKSDYNSLFNQMDPQWCDFLFTDKFRKTDIYFLWKKYYIYLNSKAAPLGFRQIPLKSSSVRCRWSENSTLQDFWFWQPDL